MALTGTLIADFSSFYGEAAKAEASLKGMETAAGKTGKSLAAMVDSVDTKPAVANVKLLETSLRGMSGTLDATVTPALDELNQQQRTGTTEAGGFKDALSEVDKVLAAAGINLGPLPKALDQLSTAAGNAGGNLTALGKAGLAVGVAMAGWQAGRWIADTLDLDEKIGNLTAKVLGWGDAAGQEAAAAAETLARASAVAGTEITSMAAAVTILQREQEKQIASQKAQAKEMEAAAKEAEKFAAFTAKLFSRDDIARAEDYVTALGGLENVTKLTTDKKRELHKVVTDALAAYEALGERAPGAMRAIARETTELIPVLTSFSSVSAKAWATFRSEAEAGGDTIEKVNQAAQLSWEDLGGVALDTLQDIAAEAEEKYQIALAASDHFTGKQIADFREAARVAQAAVDAWGTDTLEAYDAIQAASTATSAKQIADNQAVVHSVTTSWTAAMSAVSAGLGTMGGTIQGGATGSSRAQVQQAWDEGRYYGPVKNSSQDNPRGTGPDWDALGFRATGGPVSAGSAYVVGERGPELFLPSTSGRIAAGGLGSVTVNISTVMGDPQAIARLVSSALVDAARGRGERLPIGAVGA